MTRFLLNPTFDIETGALLSHDGEFFYDSIPILFDRGAVQRAKQQGQQADTAASTAETSAATERSSVLPGITRAAQNPQGFNPTDLNNMLVAQQEAAGGANATIGGEGKLSAMRTRTAGGYAPALAEAARTKGRTLATGGLDISRENAMLKEKQQQEARNQLLGLYGTDTSNQLRAMGISAEDLQNQLAAGRQGWLQNTTGMLTALGNLGAGGGLAGILRGKGGGGGGSSGGSGGGGGNGAWI